VRTADESACRRRSAGFLRAKAATAFSAS